MSSSWSKFESDEESDSLSREDHDRIVAEKDAEIARLKESLEWETALKRAIIDRHEEQTLEIARLNNELEAIEREEKGNA